MSVSVTARRVAATAIAAAAVVGAVALPASAADHGHDGWHHHTRVAIGGVQHPASSRYDRNLNQEWVDVTNASRRSVNLDGWTLSDEDGHTYTFHHYRLEGRATVRVHTGFGRDSRTDLFQDRRRSVWDTRRDTATLRNDEGRFVDSVSWGRDHRGHRDGGDWGGWGGRHH
ncbi:lamin tail domain-containing protein [Streptomyces collinus]|uniref:lamin tail domain-containing protein n=1 Tax=Streptomyces collinus TaxID=42684 RepID=UPI0029421B7E|nr:lamin tail domain-containing protein [Streptomyces collinus]